MATELEQVLISSYKTKMISFMDAHPEYFNEAVELAISNKQPFSWRAAWLLWSCMKENDRRIHPYIKKIINSLTNKDDGHQRELLKILLQMELDEKYEGFLFNVCMNVWENTTKKPSVRFTAFKFILKIAKNHPDLSKEITFLLQDHYLESLSPGVRRSLFRLAKGFIQ